MRKTPYHRLSTAFLFHTSRETLRKKNLSSFIRQLSVKNVETIHVNIHGKQGKSFLIFP